jgi:hypothetical protein
MKTILQKMRQAYREARRTHNGKPLQEIMLNLRTGEYRFVFGGKPENRDLNRGRQS